MIILHFDLQLQFKYMIYFIYTSGHTYEYQKPCLTLRLEKQPGHVEDPFYG